MIDDKPQCEYYTPSEARQLLGVGRNRMYELLQRDDFPKIRYTLGGKYYIPREPFERWCRRQWAHR